MVDIQTELRYAREVDAAWAEYQAAKRDPREAVRAAALSAYYAALKRADAKLNAAHKAGNDV